MSVFSFATNCRYNKAMNKKPICKPKGIEDFKPNKEVLLAIKEAKDMMEGKIKYKSYPSFKEAVKDLKLDA